MYLLCSLLPLPLILLSAVAAEAALAAAYSLLTWSHVRVAITTAADDAGAGAGAGAGGAGGAKAAEAAPIVPTAALGQSKILTMRQPTKGPRVCRSSYNRPTCVLQTTALVLRTARKRQQMY